MTLQNFCVEETRMVQLWDNKVNDDCGPELQPPNAQ